VSSRRSEALSACAKLLAPLVPLLLRLDISAGEFGALCKSVFVHAAAKQLAKRSRRVTQSAIAIVTGLTRAEVKRVLSQPVFSLQGKDWERQRAVRVIQGWRNDPEFSSRDGKAKDLQVKGRVGSFRSLVRKYSGDIPVRAMLDELAAMSAIRKLPDGRLRLKSQTSASTFEKGSMRTFGQRSADVMATLVHNVEAREERLFEDSVSEPIDEYLLPMLKQRIATHGENFLELIEDQLSHPPIRTSKRTTRTKRRARLGVTVVVHQSDSSVASRSKQS
jgi:hypothetical protein